MLELFLEFALTRSDTVEFEYRSRLFFGVWKRDVQRGTLLDYDK